MRQDEWEGGAMSRDEAMSTDKTMSGDQATEFEGKLTAALERRPPVKTSAGFAARVMERLPEGQPLLPERQLPEDVSRVGTRVAYVSIAMVAATLLLLVLEDPAAFAAGRGFAFVFEMMLVAELMAVGFWLGTRREA